MMNNSPRNQNVMQRLQQALRNPQQGVAQRPLQGGAVSNTPESGGYGMPSSAMPPPGAGPGKGGQPPVQPQVGQMQPMSQAPMQPVAQPVAQVNQAIQGAPEMPQSPYAGVASGAVRLAQPSQGKGGTPRPGPQY